MRLRGTLETEEQVIIGTRAHPLALLPAGCLFLGAAAAGSFASSVLPTAPFLAYLALILAIWITGVALLKMIRWATTSYLLTNYRLVIQRGVLHKKQQNVPLTIIEAVEVQRSRFTPGKQADLHVYALGTVYQLSQVPEANVYSQHIYDAQQLITRGSFA